MLNSVARLAWKSSFQSALLMAMTIFLIPMSAGSSENQQIWVTIPLGSRLFASGENYWVSQGGTFAMGFFAKHQDEAYSVGIWYNSIPKQTQVVVWTAGGDVRVSPNSTFELSGDGNLLLFDHLSGSPAWTSNTSNRGVVGAGFHGNGNFMLTDNQHRIVWESFQAPTDTLIPGQKLEENQTLRAASKNVIANYYTLALERTGDLALRWIEDTVYWKSGTGTQTFPFSNSSVPTGAMFSGDGLLLLFDEKKNIVWSRYSGDYTDQSVVLRRLTLDTDGNLRMYSWIEAKNMWVVGWQAVENQCDVFATCGLYGVCSFNSTGPICDCPFENGSNSIMLSEKGTNRACRTVVKLGSCNEGNTMMVWKHTVLYGVYPPQDIYNYSSEESCRENCLKDSSCVAATATNDGSGICKIKRTSFIAGYSYTSVPAISFLKVCLTPDAVSDHILNNNPYPPNPNSSNTFQPHSFSILSSRTSVPSATSIGLAILATVSAFLAIHVGLGWYIFKRRGMTEKKGWDSTDHQLMDPYSRSLVRLTFAEVEELTANFRHKLSPTVFKGTLPNMSPVIIKQLNNGIEEKEFRMALCILGSMRHKNLVCLNGFCCEAQHKLIVYEYVNNGSLDQWLFGCTKRAAELSWHRRFCIVVGIARAIAYLHSECHECIAHSNLKLENVMLDDKFMPKVTDFGLNTLLQGVSNESASSSESYPERDVFNFGLMLLQIISGKRDSECYFPPKEGIFIWAFREYQNGHLDSIVDSRMEGNYDLNQVERTLRIAFWCMQDKTFSRPCIREVVAVLEGTCPVDPPPIPEVLGQELHAGALNKLKQVAVEEEGIEDEEDKVKYSEEQCHLQLGTTSYGSKAK